MPLNIKEEGYGKAGDKGVVEPLYFSGIRRESLYRLQYLREHMHHGHTGAESGKRQKEEDARRWFGAASSFNGLPALNYAFVRSKARNAPEPRSDDPLLVVWCSSRSSMAVAIGPP